MKITRDARELAAKEGIADETEASNAGMKAKAAEFAASGGEIYQGNIPKSAKNIIKFAVDYAKTEVKYSP